MHRDDLAKKFSEKDMGSEAVEDTPVLENLGEPDEFELVKGQDSLWLVVGDISLLITRQKDGTKDAVQIDFYQDDGNKHDVGDGSFEEITVVAR